MKMITGARTRKTAPDAAVQRGGLERPWLWLALLGVLAALALALGADGPAASARVTAGQAAETHSASATARKKSAKRKACAGRKGKKLRRCRAVARCKKLKGKKRKKCLAKARRIGAKAKQKKKSPPTVQPQPAPFQPQGNFQFIRQAPPPVSCGPVVEFNKKNFPAEPKIDNPWLPITPGTKYVLEGRANRGGGPLPHRVTFTITDLTKVINGVKTVVVWDVDKNEGVLNEAELAFFAQDKFGNVWGLGEYPEEYTNGVFTGAPNTWINGRGDAVGGIHMLANAVVSDQWYLQGSVPSIEFLDCAHVVATGQPSCVPIFCFRNTLLTHETSPLDPQGGIQTKTHARGIGIVQVGALDDPEGETLVMVKRWRLSPAGLARARAEALKLDRRGYKNSEVYKQTRLAR